MNFLQPQYLWAFAGILVPVAIHLLSRKEGRVIRIGSIRHIRETPTRQFRSVRLNEYLLLFLRCLLLGGMVLFISGWYMEGVKATRQWLVIEPGLEGRPGLKSLIDSLSTAGYEKRFLARDFPKDLVANEATDYYALLEDLRKRRIDAVVLATNRLEGFYGPRMPLPEGVKWIEIAPGTQEAVIRQVQLARDSVWERRGTFSGTSSQFTSYRKLSDGKQGTPRDTIRVVVAYGQEFEGDKEIVLATIEAIKRQVPEVIEVNPVQLGNYSGSSPGWLIWLSASEPPAGAKSTMRFVDRPLAKILEPASKETYWITQRLNSEVAINRNFALHLMKVLVPDTEASVLAQRNDRRVVSAQAAFGGNEDLVSFGALAEADQSSMRYLAIALLLLLGLERLVAYQRRQ